MTVNELIAELQVLAAQGYGELDVARYIPYECGIDKWEGDITISVRTADYYNDDSHLVTGTFVSIS